MGLLHEGRDAGLCGIWPKIAEGLGEGGLYPDLRSLLLELGPQAQGQLLGIFGSAQDSFVPLFFEDGEKAEDYVGVDVDDDGDLGLGDVLWKVRIDVVQKRVEGVGVGHLDDGDEVVSHAVLSRLAEGASVSTGYAEAREVDQIPDEGSAELAVVEDYDLHNPLFLWAIVSILCPLPRTFEPLARVLSVPRPRLEALGGVQPHPRHSGLRYSRAQSPPRLLLSFSRQRRHSRPERSRMNGPVPQV